MGVEEIVERATVTFPTPINIAQAEEFLRYLAECAGYSVAYTIEKTVTIPGQGGNGNSPVLTGVRITGWISATNPLTTVPFSTIVACSNVPMISSMEFFPTPGSALREPDQNGQTIFDAVHSAAERYLPK